MENMTFCLRTGFGSWWLCFGG